MTGNCSLVIEKLDTFVFGLVFLFARMKGEAKATLSENVFDQWPFFFEIIWLKSGYFYFQIICWT